MNFGAYLRALREEKKLSVNQLAMYSEVSAVVFLVLKMGNAAFRSLLR